MFDPLRCSGLTLARQLAAGDVSSEELTRFFLARIDRHNPLLSAFTHVMHRRALAAARASDRYRRKHPHKRLPPLFGVPTGIKDLVPVRGTPTRLGSRAFRYFIAPFSGEVAKRITNAGLIVLGKLATSEFGAMPITEPDIHPPTRNPWNTAHTSGGSSGGSSAAVAAGLLPLAQGSDGGGSVRIPAAFCHLYGFKPSRTLLGNLHGPANKLGLSVMGPLTHTVADAAAMLDAMAGHHPDDDDASLLLASAEPPRRLHILFCDASPLGRIDKAIAAAALRTADRLANLGHHIEAVAPAAGSVEEFLPLWQQQMSVVPVLREQWLQPVTQYLRRGARTLKPSAVMAQRNALVQRTQEYFGDADMLLTPTVPILPPAVGEFAHLDAAEMFRAVAHCAAFTALFNVSGQPAASIPSGVVAGSLPFGMQLVGRRGGDRDVLRLSRQLEADAPWLGRRPSTYWTGASKKEDR